MESAQKFSTQRKCEYTKWNSGAGRVLGKTEDVRELNDHLSSIELRIYSIYKDLTTSGLDVNGEVIKAKFLGINTERSRLLLEIYEEHNKQFAALVGQEYSAGTLKRFKVCKKSIEDFLKWKYKVCDFDIRKLGNEFIADYEFYLKSEKGCAHNTTMGYIKKLKKIVRQCVANNWLDKDPFMNNKIKIRDTHRTYLLEDELQILADKNIAIERLRLVRDLFLFSCYTGLSYRDVEKLTPADIATGIDGEKWIFTTRTKTDTATRSIDYDVSLTD